MYLFSNCPQQMDWGAASSQTTRAILAVIKQRKWHRNQEMKSLFMCTQSTVLHLQTTKHL